MKDNNRILSYIAYALIFALIAVIIWGCVNKHNSNNTLSSDDMEHTEPDNMYSENSGVEVGFADILLSNQNETRKVIVGTQEGTVSVELTERLIKKLDFSFMKKSQKVSYSGTGYFAVDLDHLTASNIKEDRFEKTVTIQIRHAYLQTVEIDPSKIVIDEVQESLLARGDIKLTVSDYNEIEKELRNQMEDKFDTAENKKKADDLALKAVREIYGPIIKAIDHRYRVIVEFE